MEAKSTELHFSTAGDGDATDITAELQGLVDADGIEVGQITAFVRGSTAAITTMEYEPGGVHDLKAMLERLIPSEGDYEHNRLNHDTNSHAHQRASLIGPALSIPVVGARLVLGTWQQVVLLDFDDRPRERTVVVQVLAERKRAPLGALCFRRTCHQRDSVSLARRSSSLNRCLQSETPR